MTYQELKDDPQEFAEFWMDLPQHEGMAETLYQLWYMNSCRGVMELLNDGFDEYCRLRAEREIEK